MFSWALFQLSQCFTLLSCAYQMRRTPFATRNSTFCIQNTYPHYYPISSPFLSPQSIHLTPRPLFLCPGDINQRFSTPLKIFNCMFRVSHAVSYNLATFCYNQLCWMNCNDWRICIFICAVIIGNTFFFQLEKKVKTVLGY